VDCFFPSGKLNKNFPNVISIPSDSYEDGMNYVGKAMLNNGCGSFEGSRLGFIPVCEDPSLTIPKASEVSS
jgi:hypothetical protein